MTVKSTFLYQIMTFYQEQDNNKEITTEAKLVSWAL